MSSAFRGIRPAIGYGVATAAVIVAAALVLLAMGRSAICTCGSIELWHGTVQSAGNSQHLTDWYSFSHITHGFIFFGLGWWLLRTRPLGLRLLIATLVEAGWEIMENTPLVIDRYREATMAFGYTGDSVLNSVSDIALMVLGFWLASRLRWQIVVVLALGFEAFTLWRIRDNLTLNVLMLVAPVDAVRDWQGGAPDR